jgi:hypothetical protein
MATAWHKPEDLNTMLRPPIEETLHKAEKNPGLWDTDKWWQEGS